MDKLSTMDKSGDKSLYSSISGELRHARSELKLKIGDLRSSVYKEMQTCSEAEEVARLQNLLQATKKKLQKRCHHLRDKLMESEFSIQEEAQIYEEQLLGQLDMDWSGTDVLMSRCKYTRHRTTCRHCLTKFTSKVDDDSSTEDRTDGTKNQCQVIGPWLGGDCSSLIDPRDCGCQVIKCPHCQVSCCRGICFNIHRFMCRTSCGSAAPGQSNASTDQSSDCTHSEINERTGEKNSESGSDDDKESKSDGITSNVCPTACGRFASQLGKYLLRRSILDATDDEQLLIDRLYFDSEPLEKEMKCILKTGHWTKYTGGDLKFQKCAKCQRFLCQPCFELHTKLSILSEVDGIADLASETFSSNKTPTLRRQQQLFWNERPLIDDEDNRSEESFSFFGSKCSLSLASSSVNNSFARAMAESPAFSSDSEGEYQTNTTPRDF
jgi:hypothetical protein